MRSFPGGQRPSARLAMAAVHRARGAHVGEARRVEYRLAERQAPVLSGRRRSSLSRSTMPGIESRACHVRGDDAAAGVGAGGVEIVRRADVALVGRREHADERAVEAARGAAPAELLVPGAAPGLGERRAAVVLEPAEHQAARRLGEKHRARHRREEVASKHARDLLLAAAHAKVALAPLALFPDLPLREIGRHAERAARHARIGVDVAAEFVAGRVVRGGERGRGPEGHAHAAAGGGDVEDRAVLRGQRVCAPLREVLVEPGSRRVGVLVRGADERIVGRTRDERNHRTGTRPSAGHPASFGR